MLDNKDYCDYDTCVALKELGYVGSSRYYYTQRDHKFHYDTYNKFYTVRTADAMGYVLAIHLYDAQKWLREEKKVHIEVYACAGGYMWELCKAYETNTFSGGTTIYVFDDVANPKLNDAGRYDSYEEALLEGIKEAIKILTNNKNE